MHRGRLTAGTAAQLVINTAAFVAFSANDEQAASFAHSLGFALDFRFIFCNQLVKALAAARISASWVSAWPSHSVISISTFAS